MALELDGEQSADLRAALVDAYRDFNAAARLAEKALDLNLNLITSPGEGLEHAFFELINWSESRGHLDQLVLGAINSNPDNPKLQVVALKLGLSAATESKATLLEKVLPGNTMFADVAKWRAELQRNEWRVCRIDQGGTGVGTGFLVGPDAVLTNHHVMRAAIDGAAKAADFTVRFDYKETEAGVINSGEVVSLADDAATWLIDSAPHSPHDEETTKTGEASTEELDFALIRLAERAGAQIVAGEQKRQWITMPTADIDFSTRRGIQILQHPSRLPMKLAMGVPETIEVNEPKTRIRYTVPTEPGSSGSPVFDTDWQLIALHHSGDPKSLNPEYNEGIPVSLIAQREKVKAYLDALANEE
jgi:V8-like Glu-specific endopeptidase